MTKKPMNLKKRLSLLATLVVASLCLAQQGGFSLGDLAKWSVPQLNNAPQNELVASDGFGNLSGSGILKASLLTTANVQTYMLALEEADKTDFRDRITALEALIQELIDYKAVLLEPASVYITADGDQYVTSDGTVYVTANRYLGE